GLVGDTPLLEVSRLEREAPRARVLGKMESANPTGSVKDRICLAMVEAAEASGELRPGGVVIEPTSGNTGIGLALVCARRGYRCVLTMPESMSLERRQLLESYGAAVVLRPEAEQREGAVGRADALAAELPGAFIPHQFHHPATPEVHSRTTGPEILHARGDEPVHAFVAAVGTGGTVSGAGRALKERHPDCRIIAVEPESCPTLSGGGRGPPKTQGLAPGFSPRNYDPSDGPQ